MVDPGLAGGAEGVLAELRDAALLESVTDVLLTHHDSDHAGAAPRLQAVTGAIVWLGAPDAEVLAGRRPPGTAFRRLLGRLVRVRPLPGTVGTIDGEGLVFPGVQAIPTPGHTDGHVAFLADEVLFAGDAVWATRGPSHRGVAFRQFPDAITNDRAAAVRSEQLLRGLGARWFCPGHGPIREMAG